MQLQLYKDARRSMGVLGTYRESIHSQPYHARHNQARPSTTRHKHDSNYFPLLSLHRNHIQCREVPRTSWAIRLLPAVTVPSPINNMCNSLHLCSLAPPRGRSALGGDRRVADSPSRVPSRFSRNLDAHFRGHQIKYLTPHQAKVTIQEDPWNFQPKGLRLKRTRQPNGIRIPVNRSSCWCS